LRPLGLITAKQGERQKESKYLKVREMKGERCYIEELARGKEGGL
jgi:hypothetical protein